MASLRRTRDGAGDSGGMSVALKFEDGKIVEGGSRPRIGYAMRVGSLGARSYQYQDYWTTTLVTEILIDEGNYVQFKTGNSVYDWNE